MVTGLDNWIYNARSQYRYRWIGETLIKQATEVRGQWGITYDDFGRLFYNVNNSQLLGDFVPPNYMSRNPNYPTSAGLNLFVATDQRVFTLRMNTAVNRGYLPDVIAPSGKLYVFASSCSPVIYRGDAYPAEFQSNAFVCDPAANLIKRNLVVAKDLTLASKFAYPDHEFVASLDERFRPVSLINGPDGSLWLADMYRGIIQYGMFMSDYLRQETIQRGLDQGIHKGRIYRIAATDRQPVMAPRLRDASATQLVDLLSHANGWVRDTAQRLLIERGDLSIIEQLVQRLAVEEHGLTRIHLLWTLEGLLIDVPAEQARSGSEARQASDSPGDNRAGTGIRLLEVDPSAVFTAPELTEAVVDACVEQFSATDPQVQVAAVRVAESLTQNSRIDQDYVRQQLQELLPHAGPEVTLQITLTAGNLRKPDALTLLADIALKSADQYLIREAILSGVGHWELPFLQEVLSRIPDPSRTQPGVTALLHNLAQAVMRERHPANVQALLELVAELDPQQVTWQRTLLAGMSDPLRVRFRHPVPLRAEPPALAVLTELAGDDSQLQQQLHYLKSLLAWPGHQTEAEQPPAGRPLTPDERALVEEGQLLYRRVCAGCHGLNGLGIRPLAAPLVDSEWVLGSEQRLLRILLQGLTGPYCRA